MDGIEINGKIIRLTKHASHRAAKRKITFDEIKEVLVNPKGIRKNNHLDPKEVSYSYLGRTDIVLILNYKKSLIITMLRRSKAYSRSKAKQAKNKRQLAKKRIYGNRIKDK